MKNFNKYLNIFVLLSVIIFTYTSCRKDGGFYENEGSQSQYAGTTYDYLKSKPGVFDSLLVAIDRMGMKSIVNDSNVTLFAVSNPSFQLALRNLNTLRRQSDKDPLFIQNIDAVQLDTMTSYYIVRGKIPTDSLLLQDGKDLKGARFGYPMHAKATRRSASGQVGAGPEVIEFSNTKRSKFIRNWSTSTTSSNNIRTKNGIVHVVSPDHIFGFDEFVTRLTFVPPPPSLMVTVGGTLTVSRDSNGGPDSGEGSKKVIDGDDHTKFLVDLLGRVWMRYELKTAQVCDVYVLISANDSPDRDLKAWTFEGSQDGVNWVELDRRNNFFFEERYQPKVFRFNNTTAYKFYRIDITENRGSGVIQLAEWSINKVIK